MLGPWPEVPACAVRKPWLLSTTRLQSQSLSMLVWKPGSSMGLAVVLRHAQRSSALQCAFSLCSHCWLVQGLLSLRYHSCTCTGHYVSYVNSHGNWLFFDDEDVQLQDEAQVQTAYGSAQVLPPQRCQWDLCSVSKCPRMYAQQLTSLRGQQALSAS